MEPEASSSSPGSVTQESPRPQAGPLPSKRGEIGFRASLHAVQTSQAGNNANDTIDQDIPSRHPADRPPTGSQPSSPSTQRQQPTTESALPKKKGVLGIRNTTIVLLISQMALLLITAGLWAIAVKFVVHGKPGIYMVQVPFVLGTLTQLIFLERTFYTWRAERYMLRHPGETMPGSLLHPRRSSHVPVAPWNRLPLPDYAAVLAESGYNTGDVEDNRIAIAPPPAYGFTRGSTLVLEGFISENLRNESRRIRAERGDRMSGASQLSVHTVPLSRPVSYMSHDSDWESRCDIARARILADTLNRLDSPSTNRETSGQAQ